MATAYFFYDGIDSTWDNAGNWWADSGHSTPYGSIPQAADAVILLGSTLPSAGPGTPITLLSFDSNQAAVGSTLAAGVTTSITVNSMSDSLNIGVTGDPTSNHSWNGTITNCVGAAFYGGGHNDAAITNAVWAYFSDSAYTNAAVTVTGSNGGVGVLFEDNATCNNTCDATAAPSAIHFTGSATLTAGMISAGSVSFATGTVLGSTGTTSLITSGNIVIASGVAVGGALTTTTLNAGGNVTIGAWTVTVSAIITIAAAVDVVITGVVWSGSLTCSGNLTLDRTGTGPFTVGGNVVIPTAGTYPTAADVLTGDTYGPNGSDFTGTLTLPTASKVLTTNGAFGVGGNGSTPTLTLPTAAQTLLGVTFGVGGTGTTGNVTLPATNTVKSGTHYGSLLSLVGTYVLAAVASGLLLTGVGSLVLAWLRG